MTADEGRGGRRVLPANGRIRYGSWPGSQRGKGQPAALRGGHVNLSTPAGELIRLQNAMEPADQPANAGPRLPPEDARGLSHGRQVVKGRRRRARPHAQS